MNIIELSPDNFNHFISAPGKSFIVFTASWCQPCQDLKRVLERAFSKQAVWQLAMVDIEAYPVLAESFEVKSVPWVLVVRDGVVLFAEAGVLSLSAVNELMVQADALDMSKIKE